MINTERNTFVRIAVGTATIVALAIVLRIVTGAHDSGPHASHKIQIEYTSHSAPEDILRAFNRPGHTTKGTILEHRLHIRADTEDKLNVCTLLAYDGQQLRCVPTERNGNFRKISLPVGPHWLSLCTMQGQLFYLGFLYSSPNTSKITRYYRPAAAVLAHVTGDTSDKGSSANDGLYILPGVRSGFRVRSGSSAVLPAGPMSACWIEGDRVFGAEGQADFFTLIGGPDRKQLSFNFSIPRKERRVVEVAASSGDPADWVDCFALGRSSVDSRVAGSTLVAGGDGSISLVAWYSSQKSATTKGETPFKAYSSKSSISLSGVIGNDRCVIQAPRGWTWGEERLRLKGLGARGAAGAFVKGVASYEGDQLGFEVVLESHHQIRIPGLEQNSDVYVWEVGGVHVVVQEPEWSGARRIALRVVTEEDQANSEPLLLRIHDARQHLSELTSYTGFVSIDPIGKMDGFTPTSNVDLDRKPSRKAIADHGDYFELSLGSWPYGSYKISLFGPSIGLRSFEVRHYSTGNAVHDVHLGVEDYWTLDLSPLDLPIGSYVASGLLPNNLAVFAERVVGHSDWTLEGENRLAGIIATSGGRLLRVPRAQRAISVKVPGLPCRYLSVNPRGGVLGPFAGLGAVRGSLTHKQGFKLHVVLCSQIISPSRNRVLFTAEALPMPVDDNGEFSIDNVVPGTYALFPVLIPETPREREFLYSSDVSLICEVIANQTVDIGTLDCSGIAPRTR